MALPKLDAPRYEMKLPSTGAKVIYRPYLVKEEKILMLAMESNDEKQMVRAVKDVIHSCTEGGVDVENMTMFDMEYVFVQLRTKSVGENTKVGVTCTSCGTKNDIEINLNHTKVDVPKTKDLKIPLTKTVGMIMKYPSVDDFMRIQTSEEGTAVDKSFDIVAACIDSIYSNDEIFDAKDQTKEELREFIESLSSDQFAKIKEFLENMPSAKISVSFDCSKCNHHNEFDVKGIANFFG